LITPVKVQPAVVIWEAMKMFDVECRQMDMKLEFREDKSVKEIKWVMLDPSRLLQVLINLLYVRCYPVARNMLTS
jgi:C4-dicarboxylate-specific signal transduction histidine kinase